MRHATPSRRGVPPSCAPWTFVLLLLVSAALPAEPPGGDYASVDTLDPASLRATLHDVMKRIERIKGILSVERLRS